ncbi:5-carboxymethyl-2-hydroxymuconate Delta-isomerase [Rhizobium sp. NPDC090279]|uniref:5-carboxymethyl-2-hydroxymuconate Delta-isomerase n=1 Tax=Rhizobium sp. NPDC090279 TaxID=3364499 RepID=UPI00383AB121
MPHVVIEYSANLESEVSPVRMVETVHRAIAENPVFQIAAIRTRAVKYDHFLVADGNPENGFIAVTIRIAPGRDPATRKATSDSVLSALSRLVGDTFDRHGLALSVEVTELDDVGMSRENRFHAQQSAEPTSPAP